jgi:hypothetical protein
MTETTEKKESRKGIALRVYVLPEERLAIESLAGKAGLTVSNYLRTLGLGYQINSAVDVRQINKLTKVNADLARLGNLMLLVIDNDNRVRHFAEAHVLQMLENIKKAKAELMVVMGLILNKRVS